MKRCFGSGLGLFAAMALIAIVSVTVAAQTTTGAQDPLVQVLVQKGVLTSQDASTITGTAAEQRDRLAQLLKQKGILSAAEYDAVREPAASSAFGTTLQPIRMSPATSAATVVPAVYTQEKTQAKPAAAPPAPAFIPAVAPTRVLQLDPAKPGGLVPDIKLGSKASMKIYGFFKSSVAYDSSSPYGNDFPLPGFIGGDSGPGKSPEFHVKARAFRIGSNFEWPDVSKNITITGRIEADFEGDFTRVANRSISSIRSSQFSLRLAWGRIDYRPTDNTSVFLLAGQDWTPFGSSILPNQLETTIFGVGFGNLYEREPQFRVGMLHNFGGSRKFTISPEFAIALPAFGVTPGALPTAATFTNCTPTTGTSCAGSVGVTDLADQLAYGERVGPDSAKPAIEGRLVFQFQADKAKGVAPAQIVFSGMHANRAANVSRASLNSTTTAPFTGVSAADKAAILAAFRTGANVESYRWGTQGGFSVPTRFVTVQAQYYRGADLRWYFQGGLYPSFNNNQGLQTGTTQGVVSMDAASTVIFGCARGTGGTTGVGCIPTVAPQVPVRAQGGFVELGFPLSRIAHAEPTGRNAGWTLNLHYGIDAPFARDVRAASNNGNQRGAAGGRGISDLGFGNIQWKFNQFVTFGVEESYYRTRSFAGATGTLPTFNGGLPSHQWHDFRSEFFTIFTF